MLIEVLNVNEFVHVNEWKEVKVSNYFVPNTSENHPDGLVSNEIFGSPGSPERKFNWGYIKLNDVFMNPHVFYVFRRLKAKIADDMKMGLGLYYVDKVGELIKLEENQTVPTSALSEAGTGWRWLSDNWGNVSWRVTKDMTKTAKIRRTFLKSQPVDYAFINIYPVMPAFYRDVDYRSQKRNEFNTRFYSKIIQLANVIEHTDNFTFSDNPDVPLASTAHIKMQNVINEFYDFIMGKVAGANGFINDHVVGKSTDYGARLVISTPGFNTESYKDNETDFFHSSVPLSVAVNIFAPFMIFNLTQYITNYVSGKKELYHFNYITEKFELKELDPLYLDDFTVDHIRRNLDLYKKSKLHRVKPVTLRAKDGSRIPLQVYYKYDMERKMVSFDTEPYQHYEEMELKNKIRDITWCELLYIISFYSLKDKTIFNTRYPVVHYNSTYPSLMNIIPANKNTRALVNGVLYERYPIINCKDDSEVEHLFTDTMQMFSVYPAALGADFDGDQISTAGVFTEEANADAIKHMKEISNVLGIDGGIVREFPQVTQHGIYGLTYKTTKPKE